jgi:hypothetical protein
VYGTYVFSHYINIIGIGQKLMCPIQFQSFLGLLAYSKAKLKSIGDIAPSCFRPFWTGDLSDTIFACTDSTVGCIFDSVILDYRYEATISVPIIVAICFSHDVGSRCCKMVFQQSQFLFLRNSVFQWPCGKSNLVSKENSIDKRNMNWLVRRSLLKLQSEEYVVIT